MKRIFLLYSDIVQTNLLAVAQTVKKRKEVTKEYTYGQWFSYEMAPGHVFYGDTEELVSCRFPKVAIKTDLKGNVIKNGED